MFSIHFMINESLIKKEISFTHYKKFDILKYTVIFIAGISIGILINIYFFRFFFKKSNIHSIRLSGYKYINPLLEYEFDEDLIGEKIIPPFKYKIKNFIEHKVASGDAINVSVYFRDLENGQWFGINENEYFTPASLLKLPIMVAWFKRTEKDPDVLNKTFIFNGEEDLTLLQNFQPLKKIQPGIPYTVDELIKYMMFYSDNNACSLLANNLDIYEIEKIFIDININYITNKQDDNISLAAYCSFYRILYNASYLNKEMSEKALELLSHQNFSYGILGGLPKGVPIANKFGEINLGNDKCQLHDIGIIYHHSRPYLLGIMTRGKNFNKLAVIIKDISRMVYEEVDAYTLNNRNQ